jgi:autotransporter-associated beta strand protein
LLEGRNLLAANLMVGARQSGHLDLHGSHLVAAISASIAPDFGQHHQYQFLASGAGTISLTSAANVHSSGVTATGGTLIAAGSPAASGSQRCLMRAAASQRLDGGMLPSGGTLAYNGGTNVNGSTPQLGAIQPNIVNVPPPGANQLYIGDSGAESYVPPYDYFGGTGTTTLTGMNTYSGTVNIGGGTLRLNNNSGLAATGSSAGALTLAAANTTLNGAVTLTAATLTPFGSGAGTLVIDGAPSLGGNSALSVDGGTLRFNNALGAPTIGTGVTATPGNGATLELAGTVSALGTTTIANQLNTTGTSTTAPGGSLVVSGTGQPVGAFDGSGNTVLNAGSGLTSNHIVQGALTIGGTATPPAFVTIDTSDSSGNPLATSSGFRLAGSLSPSAPFGSGTLDSSSLLAVDRSSSGVSLAGATLGSSLTAV